MLINLKLAVIFMTYRPCFTIPWRLDSLEEYREQRGTGFCVFFPFAFFFFNFSCCGIVLQKTAVRWKLRGKLFCRMQQSFRKSEQRQNILRWLHILCKRVNKYLYSCHLYKTAFPAHFTFLQRLTTFLSSFQNGFLSRSPSPRPRWSRLSVRGLEELDGPYESLGLRVTV